MTPRTESDSGPRTVTRVVTEIIAAAGRGQVTGPSHTRSLPVGQLLQRRPAAAAASGRFRRRGA